MKAGPIYLSKSDFGAYKALTMYMRNRNFGNVRPAMKSVVLLQREKEDELYRITLTDKSIAIRKQSKPANTCKIVRLVDGAVFDSLNKAMQATTMPKGAKSYATVDKRVAEGVSLFEASGGIFILTTE